MNRPRSAGFTIVELLVVTVLAAVILGAIYQTITVQERSYRQTGAIIATQQTMRTALDVLEAELREVSAAGGDLFMARPESIGFRAFRAIGFVCRADIPGLKLDVWELGEPFTAGGGADSVIVFIENDPAIGTDDQWQTTKISSVSTADCPDWNGYPERRLNLSGGSIAGIRPGAPIRSFRRLTYGIQQIGGRWVLARRDPVQGTDALVGPLAPPSDSGLAFRYFDANGNPTTNPAAVARIWIMVKGRTPGTGLLGSTAYGDSLFTQLFLRNN